MTIMKLIDKDTLLAEIDKAIDEPAPSHDQQCPWEDGYYCGLYKAEGIIDTLVSKEVDLEEEVDKDDYRNLFKDCTKLNIDSTTEIKFDESTKFSIEDYIKLKEEEKTNSSKFYKRIFKNIPTVSMKIFSWWNTNKRKEI